MNLAVDSDGQMSKKQKWLEQADWQEEIPVPEDRASIEAAFACLHDSAEYVSEKPENSITEYLEKLLGLIQGHLGCQGIGIFGRNPQWQPIAKLGGRSLARPDSAWLDEACQRKACGFVPDVPANGWGQIACPLAATLSGVPLEMLVISGRHIREDSLSAVLLLVQFLEKIWNLLDQSLLAKSKSKSLTQLCNDFTSLLHAKTTHELLNLLVEHSTVLLECERATIFIRDIRRKQLIASPALGLNGQSLVIPEEAGIVGEVVQTGRSLIVADVKTDTRFGDQFDQQTGFQTRDILCVPLRDEKQNIIGAFECLNKTSGNFSEQDLFLLELLAHHAAISIQKTQLRQELLRRQNDLQSESCAQCELIGESTATKAIRAHVGRLCTSDLPVLITGETGTGKETVAQALHYQGSRSNKPFAVVHCTEWSEPGKMNSDSTTGHTPVESLLLEKVEQAEAGTLFLDDIGCLNAQGQEIVLRLLEQGTIMPAGNNRELPVDVRVVAATNIPLVDQVLEGKFREDLYYRLAVVSIDLPPLRERLDDIAPLVNHFLKTHCKNARRTLLSCSAETVQELLKYSWPGNAKELNNVIERLVFVCRGQEISPEDVAVLCGPDSSRSDSKTSHSLTDATLEFQQRFIRQAIAREKGNMTAAARLLGLHRSNLYRKMRQLKMAEAKEEEEEPSSLQQ